MLYIVATPIGNLGEITYRAVEVLKNVDLIAAEDTRHSRVLLDKYGINVPVVSYQKFNEKASAAGLVQMMKEGKDVALISDAGMPLISDPGQILTEECIKNDVPYTVVSGASAFVNALLLSGLDSTTFLMAGFLPDKTKEREAKLNDLLTVKATLIFYSPPQSVTSDLEFLHKKLGDRRAAVVREISKIHESVARGRLGDMPEFTAKGEFVILVEGYTESAEEMSATELAAEYIKMGMERMDAIKRAAKDKGLKKSEVYAMLLKEEK